MGLLNFIQNFLGKNKKNNKKPGTKLYCSINGIIQEIPFDSRIFPFLLEYISQRDITQKERKKLAAIETTIHSYNDLLQEKMLVNIFNRDLTFEERIRLNNILNTSPTYWHAAGDPNLCNRVQRDGGSYR